MLWASAHYLLYTNIWRSVHLATDFPGLGYDDVLNHQAKCWKEHTLQDAELHLLIKGLRNWKAQATEASIQVSLHYVVSEVQVLPSPVTGSWIYRDTLNSPSLQLYQFSGSDVSAARAISPSLLLSLSIFYAIPKLGRGWLCGHLAW